MPQTRHLPRSIIGPIRMEASPANIGLPGVMGVYRITCKPLRKHYIGSSVDVAGRWLEHQVDLWQGRHMNRNLQAAFDHYGPRGFTVEVLEVISGRYDEVRLTLAEQRWLDRHEARFNVRPAGSNEYLAKTRSGRAAVQAAHQEGRIPRYCKSTGRLAPTKGCLCFACRFHRGLKEA